MKAEGLNYEELVELLKHIEENHSWKNMYNICHKNENQKIIKYVEFGFDTRDCDVWFIRFHSVSGKGKDPMEFRTESGYNLKERVYAWLKS